MTSTDHDLGSSAGRVSRRGVLSGLGAATGTVLLAGCASGAPPAAPPPGTPAPRPPASPSPADPLNLFDNPSMNFEALTCLGSAGYGNSEVGEVITAVNTVNGAGGTLQAYPDPRAALGGSLRRRSDDAMAAGHVRTAGDCALRAAEYYGRALYFVFGTTDPGREQAIYQAGRDMWDRFTTTLSPPAEFLRIPYGTTSLPAWFVRPEPGDRPRPTLIMTNGSDGQNVSMWATGAAAGVGRGWNVLVYDGPGQGEALFVNKIPFTTTWEQVVTPIVNVLLRRADVDPRRIALSGLSMGGDLAPRAAAFEHRLAALVAMPGAVSPWAAFPSSIQNIVTPNKDETNQIWNTKVVPALPPPAAFELKKRYEPFGAEVVDAARQGKLFTDIWTPSQIIKGLDIAAVAGQITCPTLVLNYDEEAFYPGQAGQLVDLLRSPKTYITLSAADGAQLHCSPMAPQHQAETVFDYLEDTLRGPR